MNPLERLNSEIKRRADAGSPPNSRSVIRLVGVPMLEQCDEWAISGRYMSMESLGTLSDNPIRLFAVTP